MCSRCVMDTTDPEIAFDDNGVCNHCKTSQNILKREPFTLSQSEKETKLAKIIENIKTAGNGRYDCIIGLSGGVDSSYVACKVKDFGMNPLAIHLDNGWNSEIAVANIENVCKTLNIDLFTHVIDWEEFKDLQMSFLKSSTPDSEIPSDHAIYAILYRMARKYKLKYILWGINMVSESIMPRAWSQGHWDWTYIKAVQKRFGSKPLKTFPHMSYWTHIYNRLFETIKFVNILDYINYDKEKAKSYIKQRIGWNDYGRKHGESFYTRFFQEYILPSKFGFDKRKGHFSSLIIAGQLNREKALELLQQPLYLTQEAISDDIDYLVTKFGITRNDFESIMRLPVKSYWDYPNFQKRWYYSIFRKLYYRFTGKSSS